MSKLKYLAFVFILGCSKSPFNSSYVWDKEGCIEASKYYRYKYGCMSKWVTNRTKDECFIKAPDAILMQQKKLKLEIEKICTPTKKEKKNEQTTSRK